jgi:hypothetical protein
MNGPRTKGSFVTIYKPANVTNGSSTFRFHPAQIKHPQILFHKSIRPQPEP